MRERLLRLLRLRERPDPPPGSGALETFRASRRYLYLSAVAWFPKQLSALAGLVFALVFFGTIDAPFLRAEGWMGFLDNLDDAFRFEIGAWTLPPSTLFVFLELLAVAGFVAQLVFSGATVYLDWRLRWYMVGEEALRIREGLWTVHEQTISIANVQKMTIRQGPVHKLFGVAELEVHTAGGGAGGGEGGEAKGAHVARFRGLEDVEGLRDRIRARLVLHKGAGLGDADEFQDTASSPGDTGDAGELAVAARQLAEETRALRRALAGRLRA